VIFFDFLFPYLTPTLNDVAILPKFSTSSPFIECFKLDITYVRQRNRRIIIPPFDVDAHLFQYRLNYNDLAQCLKHLIDIHQTCFIPSILP